MGNSRSDKSEIAPSVPPSPTSVRSGRSSVPTTITYAASDTPLVPPQPHNGSATPQTPTPPAFSMMERLRENRQGDGVEGWPLLAKLMAKKSDFEAFDRFEELNVKNLLYFQVELAKIQRKLETRERADRDSLPDSERSRFCTEANKLVGSDSSQWKAVLDMRKCLDGYNRALLQYSQISSLPEPSRRNMNTLLSWLVSPEACNFNVTGTGSNAWGDMYARQAVGFKKPSLASQFFGLLLSIVTPRPEPPSVQNLVAPRGRRSVDGLSRWIAEEAIPFWAAVKEAWKNRKVKKSQEEEEGNAQTPAVLESVLTVYSEKKDPAEELKDLKLNFIDSYSGSSILGFSTKLTTLFACMLPMVAIGVLYVVENLSRRLGLIAGFTAIFCNGLMMVAEVTRVQVFTATSAFLAVLVVFVQTG
ncbi:putative isoleucyl-tRNA synthetase [Podospora australis]|uniref:Isoleucyl-tRNA synthetase n=1 Tax=Podospora australis TaxID=1536484 RepID=A0AAN6WVC8_9PEZI|nr:putative isoleucyl-tRNA synthetase [Podospora australis]